MHIRAITPEEIENYQTRGAAYLPQFVDPETAELLRLECLRADRPAGRYKNALSETGSFYEERFITGDSPPLQDYAFNAEIGRSVAQAMNSPTARFLFDHLLVCGPNTPVENYWHQDISYWPIEGQQICSIWLTLTDCTVESSALELVLDSDKQGVYSIRPFGEEDMGDEVRKNYDKGSIPKYHLLRDKYDILSHDLKAGDAYIFNARTMHASGGNRSKDLQRVAYSVRYIGEDVTWHPRPAFDQEALTPDDVVLKVGERFRGRMFPEVWPGRAA
jgi:ectoine hydroxylase-related dioxygenase (phytanoyl-CoA dioxygenase family)